MNHKPIRNISKRFQIIFYHLEKIREDWGECRGLSSNDVGKMVVGPYAELKQLFESRQISAFPDSPFISEEEFEPASKKDKKEDG